VLSFLPPALVGYVLERPIEQRLGTPATVAAGLVAGALAMAAADAAGGGARRREDAGACDALCLGLAQAFLSRGAETVVASTRPVTDDTAAALMRAFYRIHASGQPAAVALQRAQLGVRDADGRADWPALRVLER